jgi:Bacterial SH3 domain
MQVTARGATIRARAAAARARLLPVLVVVPLLTACTGLMRTSTPTPAPVSTAAIVFATTAPATLQTTVSTPIPPPLTPTSPPIPTPVPAAQRPANVYVANTGTDGLSLRTTPATDGERIALLPEGAPLTPTGQEQQVEGRRWRQVRDSQGREGWVAADFLSPSAPLVTSAGASPVTDRPTPPPTQPIAVPPPPPTPTRQPTRVPEQSAPVAPSKPQAPAVIVPTIGTRFSPPASPTPR